MTGADFATEGVAITSSWYPDDNTHVELLRYGKAQTRWGCCSLFSPHPSPENLGGVCPRAGSTAEYRAATAGRPRWSERTVISLIMQPVDAR